MQATASGEQHIEDNIIFAAGEGGDSQLFELIRVTVGILLQYLVTHNMLFTQ